MIARYVSIDCNACYDTLNLNQVLQGKHIGYVPLSIHPFAIIKPSYLQRLQLWVVSFNTWHPFLLGISFRYFYNTIFYNSGMITASQTYSILYPCGVLKPQYTFFLYLPTQIPLHHHNHITKFLTNIILKVCFFLWYGCPFIGRITVLLTERLCWII